MSKSCVSQWFVLAILLVSQVGVGQLFSQEQVSQERASQGQRYAVLIGVNDYTHLSDLKYCDSDMQALQKAFIAAGFPENNVTLMVGNSQRNELLPFRNNVVEQLKVLLGGLQKNDLIIVAFSGHGVHLKGVDYFCPVDSKVDDPETTMVPVELVKTMLQKSNAQQKVLIIDACRNDPFPDDTRSVGENSLVTDFQRSISRRDTASKGIMVMASCAVKQVSIEDPDLGHGVFMNFVINGLLGHADANRDKQVTLLELHMYAEYETRNYVRVTRSMLQTPNLRGDMTGNYVLATVSERPTTLDVISVSTTTANDHGPSVIEMKLYDQAYALFQEGKNEQAIREFKLLLSVAENKQLLRIVRLKLASAYLTIDSSNNIAAALEIYKVAGLDTMPVMALADQTEIKLGQRVLGTVRRGQMLGISKVSGDWFLVSSIDGKPLDSDRRGYVYKTVFQKPAPPQGDALAGGGQSDDYYYYDDSYGYGYGYGYGDHDHGHDDDHYDDATGALRTIHRQLDEGYEELERMERRGASDAAIRAKEKDLQRKEDRYDRKEDQRFDREDRRSRNRR